MLPNPNWHLWHCLHHRLHLHDLLGWALVESSPLPQLLALQSVLGRLLSEGLRETVFVLSGQSTGTEDIRCRAREVFQPKAAVRLRIWGSLVVVVSCQVVCEAGKEERRAAFRRRRRSGSIRCRVLKDAFGLFEAGGAVGFIWLIALWSTGQHTEKTQGDRKAFEGSLLFDPPWFKQPPCV